MSGTRFAISYSRVMLPLLRLLGLGPNQSGLQVDQDCIRVRMGWGFRASIPRSAVRRVARDDGVVTGWGVHGWRGQWLVNGSSAGLVRIEIDPATRAWTMGFPVLLRTLRVSTTEPDQLISTLVASP